MAIPCQQNQVTKWLTMASQDIPRTGKKLKWEFKASQVDQKLLDQIQQIQESTILL
jgi:hypothetical protein